MTAGPGRHPVRSNERRPPRVFTWILTTALPPDRRGRSILGDLLEEWHGRPAGARRTAWYAIESLRLAAHYLVVRRRLPGVRGPSALEDAVLGDLRLALRAVRRDPGVFGVAALSLALGIAALTTVWAATDVLVLRPYSFDPDGSLILVGTSVARRGNPGSPTSIADFVELRTRSRTLEVAAYRDGGANLGTDPATWTSVRHASVDFFDVVGVAPALGRAFVPADEDRGAAEVALLDHGLWEQRFGSDPGVLGRTVLVDGRPVTVVGVVPAGFQFSRGAPDLWLPLHVDDPEVPGSRSLYVFGRLRGAGLEAARVELSSVSRALAEEHPGTNAERTFVSGRLRETLTGSPTLQQGVGAIVVASLAVLLIACANVANLLLARGTARWGDLTLRLALGAGGWRIARQLFAEAFVLATVAGIMGIALSALGMRGFASLLPPELPRAGEVALDGRAATLSMVAAWTSVLVFGLVPILRTLGSARRALSAGGQGAAAAGGVSMGRLRSALVAGEVALALVLVATTTLVLRSLSAIRSLDTGFAVEDVVAFDLALPEPEYPDADALGRAALRLADALRTTPGVDGGGVGVGLPGRDWRSLSYRLPDETAQDGEDRAPTVVTRFASPGYLATLGVEVVRGRSIAAGDDGRSAAVAVVNRRFAERVWPDADPVGRTVVLGGRRVEVVGVTPDLLEMGPLGSPAAVYLPLAQWPSRTLSVVVRAPTRSRDVRDLVRDIVARVDPTLAPHGTATMEEILLLSMDKTVALGKTLGVLSTVALVLALVGVFGSMAYSVGRRIPEIGIRMALGAAPEKIRGMVLRSAAAVCLGGLAVGLLLALAAARGVTAFLFGVSATEPSTFLWSGALLLSVCLVAAWIPARRASTVDPVRALRADG